MTGVLDDIRVLDFGRYVAGPYCATLLGYLGAEVIRIEKPTGGEDRYVAPCASGGEGGVFLQTGCNKKSLTLKLGHTGARAILDRLVASADVVVVNLPNRARQRLGLDEPSLRSIKPDVIVAAQTAFGDAGPDADKGGFDGVGQALSGAMTMTGTPGAPVKAAAPYVDFSTGIFAAFGVLAALLHRHKTGEGQAVNATLLGSALAAFNSHLVEESVLNLNREPTGNRVQTSGPSDVVATRDGHILVHTVGNGLFLRVAKLLNRPDWADDPRFVNDQSRGDHRDELCAALADWAKGLATSDALAALEASGVPAGPVYDLSEALANPQVNAMGFLKAVDYPGLPQPAMVADLPVELTASGGGIHSRPPLLGEHTSEILTSLGYTQAQISNWRTDGLI